MMVIVANTVLIQRRGTGRLNATQQPLLHQQMERIVYGLTRDRTELPANLLSHRIGRAMRKRRDHAEDRQSLRSYLHPMSSQQIDYIAVHPHVLGQFWTM